MQSEKITEIKAWLKKAKDDLRGAEIDLAANPPFLEDALFHCQQSVEKAIKGFLTAHDKLFPKTHDLDELISVCATIDKALEDKLDPARDLSVFAWEFRYPGDAEVPSQQEVRDVLMIARKTYDIILEKLSELLIL